MNQRYPDLERLSLIDPSRDRVLTDSEERRAAAALERIMAETAPSTQPSTSPQASTNRRLKVVGGFGGGTVALVVGGLLFSGAASAAWKPVPDIASPAQAAEQATECTASWPDDRPTGQVAASDILLAERRGDGRLTLLKKGDTVVSCFDIGVGGAGWGVIYDPIVSTKTAPADDNVRVFSVETTGDGAAGYTDIIGRVGKDVTGVEVIAPDGTVVTASVSDGWFAVWFPGADPRGSLTTQVVVHSGGAERTSVATDLE